MGYLPSISLVRVQDGEAFEVPIEKAYKDTVRGHRFLGSPALLERFRDRNVGGHSGHSF